MELAQIYASVMVLALYICFYALALARDGLKSFKQPLTMVLLCLTIHSVACLCSNIIDYHHSSVFWQYVCCTVYSVVGHFAMFFYGRFFMESCEGDKKAVAFTNVLNNVTLFFNLACTLPLIPSGLYFSVSPDCVYTRGRLFILSYLFIAIELGFTAVYSFIKLNKLKKTIAFIFFAIFPLIVTIIMFVYDLPSIWYDFATIISCFMLYSLVYLNDMRISMENEAKLEKYKTNVMLSQIRPHFIYNTLSTISALCAINPEKAQTLTTDFSEYLRSNLNLAQAEDLSSFETELDHTKKYLDIEQVRFGSRLNVVYDIQESNFSLPTLSLQTLVENAVKHGIMKKDQGGTIRISSYKNDGNFVVLIKDDGVGFSVRDYKPIEGHYGIPTVRDRLRILLDGELQISSALGVGTTVKLNIPNKEA